MIYTFETHSLKFIIHPMDLRYGQYETECSFCKTMIQKGVRHFCFYLWVNDLIKRSEERYFYKFCPDCIINVKREEIEEKLHLIDEETNQIIPIGFFRTNALSAIEHAIASYKEVVAEQTIDYL